MTRNYIGKVGGSKVLGRGNMPNTKSRRGHRYV